jgi:hypothetical protein
MPAMKKESKPKIKITGKSSTSGGGKNTPTLKLNQYGQPIKSKTSTKKSSPSLASQAGKVAGKVAGQVAGAAKSKVKADIKAAKTVAGFAAKVAMAPSKAIVKELRGPKRQVGKIKKLMSNKTTKK